MFIGILGHARGMENKEIVKLCGRFSKAFTEKYGSLLCRDLRPGGFKKTDPPHLCESLTVSSVGFSLTFIQELFSQYTSV